MNSEPARSSIFTLPVTRACEDSSSASMSRQTGSRCWPSCTMSPWWPERRNFLMRACLAVSTSFSSSRCAVSRTSAAGGHERLALGADHGIADVDAAPDSERPGEGFEALDDRDGGERDAVEEGGDALLKADRVARRIAGRIKGMLGQYPRAFRNAALRVQRLLAADRHAPQAAIHGICGTEWRHRQSPILDGVLQLLRTLNTRTVAISARIGCGAAYAARLNRARSLPAAVPSRARPSVDFRVRAIWAMVCACSTLAPTHRELQPAAPHVAHDEVFQHLPEEARARVDLMVRDGAQGLGP